LVYSPETTQKKITDKRELGKVFISKMKTIQELDDKLQRIYSNLLKNVNFKHRLWKLDPLYEIAQIFQSNASKVKIQGNLLEPQIKIKDSEISAKDVVALEYKFIPGNSWIFTSDSANSAKKEGQASSMNQTNCITPLSDEQLMKRYAQESAQKEGQASSMNQINCITPLSDEQLMQRYAQEPVNEFEQNEIATLRGKLIKVTSELNKTKKVVTSQAKALESMQIALINTERVEVKRNTVDENSPSRIKIDNDPKIAEYLSTIAQLKQELEATKQELAKKNEHLSLFQAAINFSSK